ncbi:TetR family transcriptional regulator [Altererythrobacter salegens]|uniref:TetR family transcriptional regulator n=1 Tax=Croceibacterium salegens TaxID=1737568 RepID=A0A6I4SU83_9SPHN|nr:TetR/AcrR family transcriptional regulator [Croceibacterium salegens]MXO58968.1 TetR family transcriptional regulator [Croceibacterium salegens]
MGRTKIDNVSNNGRRAQAGEERRARTRSAILAAGFDLLGKEPGTQLRVEDIARAAKVTRATFYNHFGGTAELREAISYELTHDFLNRTILTISKLENPAERASCAIRFYLRRARSNPSWAKSLINISANGIIFGAETYRQAEVTIMEGMEAGQFKLRNSALGRDLVLGTCLAAMSNMLHEKTPEDYPELISGHVLSALGLPFDKARELANLPLPELAELPRS